LLGVCLFSIASLSYALSDSNAQELFNVGYRVIDLAYRSGRQDQTLTMAIWYPTAARPRPYQYGGPTSGNIAVDATPFAERGPYPLLVFSHGYGGSGIGAVFLTEALAARGWVVAAPDHHDRHSAVRIRTPQVNDYDRVGLLRHAMKIAASGREDRGEFLYRLDEIKFVMDRMLSSESFKNIIDMGRIAVGGHSFGGFTALGVCGTIQERHDPRIKAILLFSTGAGGYLFNENELSSVRIPSMLFLGEKEKNRLRGRDITMSEIADKIYRNMPPPKYFLEVKGANHLSFNNRFTDGRASRFLGGNDEKLFDVIRRYSIAFLESYVGGKKDALKVLHRGDPLLRRYLKEPNRDDPEQKPNK